MKLDHSGELFWEHSQLIECMGICVLSLAYGSELRGSDVIVSRCGLAVRRLAGKQMVRSASALLSLLFKNCGLWTLSSDFAHTVNETLKMAHTTVHLNAESFWW